MKRFISYVLLLLFLVVLLWIDFPENIPIRFSIGSLKVNQTLNPPVIDTNIFGKEFYKDFKTRLGLDLKGGSHLVFDADVLDIPSQNKKDALESARNIIERRVNFFGVAEPNVQTIRTGTNYRIVVDLPGTQNVQEAVSLIGQTARLDFTEKNPEIDKKATDTPDFILYNKKTKLTGKNVKKATVQFDSKGRPAVGLEFDSEGAKLFEEITGRNVGERVGIFLDGFPLSLPVVEQRISGGEAIITGNFTVKDAKTLAVSINSGALPVSVKLVEQRSIGPSLGAEHIKKSIFAGIVGLGAVIVFMIAYYGRMGIIASIALFLYGLISFAIIRSIPVVLTLPGIAGFILSIGMAVDSNILIFERIKEEVRRGKDMNTAIRLGFGRAIDAIKDANLTTLLVAFILFNPLNWGFFPQFGLIKGFALTLGIGVATSLFTGIVITKRIIDFVYRKK